ncbi:hypothetical protein OIU85_012559 [Salix viminalis]|uniref:Uncharacterized protein n=1 Tax=Salix viminalis TaxID=40686 RepID=A0A9Q0SDC3_SALVM|nr:hypothetical protein OIU85_012559 [Salix viminalis]
MTLEAPMVLNIISHKNWLLLPSGWTVDNPWTRSEFSSITRTHYKDGVLGAFSLPFQLIGNMGKIDYNTQNNHGGRFTRVKFDFDLDKLKEKTEDLDQEVSHEGLPQVCYTYGQVGHNSILCSFSKLLRNQLVKLMIESTGLGLSALRDIYIW